MSRLLGIGCGQLAGSAEILLKEALRAAAAEGAEVELVRLEELRIPSGPDAPEPDDAWWLWDKLVECDALIVSTPIISRTVAARLKLVADRLLGPNADAAIIEALVAAKRAGQDPGVPFRVDERVLKPRVAGLHRGRRVVDVAVEDARAADPAHGHVLDAHGGRRPGAVRGRGNAAVDRAPARGDRAGGAARPQRGDADRPRVRGRRVPRRRRACARSATSTSSRCAAATSSARRAAPAACSRAAACAGPTSTPR